MVGKVIGRSSAADSSSSAAASPKTVVAAAWVARSRNECPTPSRMPRLSATPAVLGPGSRVLHARGHRRADVRGDLLRQRRRGLADVGQHRGHRVPLSNGREPVSS